MQNPPSRIENVAVNINFDYMIIMGRFGKASMAKSFSEIIVLSILGPLCKFHIIKHKL